MQTSRNDNFITSNHETLNENENLKSVQNNHYSSLKEEHEHTTFESHIPMDAMQQSTTEIESSKSHNDTSYNTFVTPVYLPQASRKRKALITVVDGKRNPTSKISVLKQKGTKSLSSVSRPSQSPKVDLRILQGFTGSSGYKMLRQIELLDSPSQNAQRLEERKFQLQRVIKDPKRLQEMNKIFANRLEVIQPKVLSQGNLSPSEKGHECIQGTENKLYILNNANHSNDVQNGIGGAKKLASSPYPQNSGLKKQMFLQTEDMKQLSSPQKSPVGKISPYRQTMSIHQDYKKFSPNESAQSNLTPFQRSLLQKHDEKIKIHMQSKTSSIPIVEKKPRNHLFPYHPCQDTWNGVLPNHPSSRSPLYEKDPNLDVSPTHELHNHFGKPKNSRFGIPYTHTDPNISDCFPPSL